MPAVEQMYFPISELSPYHQEWTIRARVTNKGQLRTFNSKDKNKSAGSGKLFNVQLLDAQGGEIQASFFNEACDLYHKKMEKGKCYVLSGGTVKVARREFNVSKHRYEITFDKTCRIEEVANDEQIDEINFSFTDLRSCQQRQVPFTVDLCGIITGVGTCVVFTSKAGVDLVKRDIIVVDDSATSMGITVWGEPAKQEDRMFGGERLVALKGVVVKEYNGGRTGSLSESGTIQFDPAMPDALKVQQWWAKGGNQQDIVSLTLQREGGGQPRQDRGTPVDFVGLRSALEQLTDRAPEKPEIYRVTCRLAMVMTKKQGEAVPLYYNACQEPKDGNGFPCGKRVDASGFCAACGRTGVAAPRFHARFRFADYADTQWLAAFNDPAEVIFGCTAEEAQSLEKGAGGREAFEASIRQRFFQDPMQVTVRAKLENWNGETRSNVMCVDAKPVSRSQHGHQLLREIQEMVAGGACLGGA
jgi:replication factor A1